MSAGVSLHFFLPFFVSWTVYPVVPAQAAHQKKRGGNRDLHAEFLNFASLNEEGGTARQ